MSPITSFLRQSNAFRVIETFEARRMLTTLVVDLVDAACKEAGPVYCDIQHAVDDASDGDRIEVATGTCSSVNVTELNDLIIEAASPDTEPTIDAGGGDHGLKTDANADGRFNSSDLIIALAAGRFETRQPATFSEGDWNTDGVFDSLDLIAALASGHFTAEARPVSIDFDVATDALFA